MELREEGGGDFFLIRPLPKSKAMVKAKEISPLLPFSRRRGRKQKNRILPRLEFPWVTGESNRGNVTGGTFPRKIASPIFTLHAAKEFGHVRRKMYLSFSQIRIIGFMWTSALTPLWRRNPCSDQVFDPPIHEQRADLDAQISCGPIVRCQREEMPAFETDGLGIIYHRTCFT